MNHTPSTKIVSVNIGGNLHDVAKYCRMFGLSDFLLSASGVGGASVALFKFPIDWPCDQHGPLPAEGFPIEACAWCGVEMAQSKMTLVSGIFGMSNYRCPECQQKHEQEKEAEIE